MKVKLVCPQCSYGFEAEKDEEHVCQNPDCAYRWQDLSTTMVSAFTAEGRQARPEIAVRSGERSGLVYAVEEPGVVLGRAEDCDITFSNLAVSRRHLEIQRSGDQCVLVDLDSRLGTYLNGRRVQRAVLEMGDQILISGILIEYRVRYEASGRLEVLPPPEHGVTAASPDGLQQVIRFRKDPVERIPCEGERLTVGRHFEADVCIEHPLVSRKHAILLREGEGWSVIDTKSRNGTFVNGRAVIRSRIERGDRLQFGPVRFLCEGEALVYQRAYSQVSLAGHGLTVRVEDEITILEDVDLRIEPSELVGIIGPSGSGKTTLLNALSGFRRATEGQVTVNGEDLFSAYSTFRTSMGYVPQDDIIHTELTPAQALRYAGKLRLPRDTSASELERIVDETLDTLDLTDRRDLPIHRLSGGQRKRVSLGVELLTQASLIFMDEPTSGLDPGTEARMMRLFRKLADQGRTIVLTTHVMENVDILDKVIVLAGGCLVYFGPPKDMQMSYFGIPRATELYERLRQREPSEWKALYARSRERKRYLGSHRPRDAQPGRASERAPGPRAVDTFTQIRVLAQRYARILTGDRRNIALMVVQPVLIFPILCAVFQRAGSILFLSALAMFWLGTTNAAREIVKERAIYLRERMVGVHVAPYVLSKVLVLSVVSLGQTLFAVGVLKLLEGLPGSAVLYGLAFLTATLSGLALGLFLSCVASTSEQATASLPLVLIPQIVFGGEVLAVERMNVPSQIVSYVISTRWSQEALDYIFQERYYGVIYRDVGIVLVFALAFTMLAIAYLGWRDRVTS